MKSETSVNKPNKKSRPEQRLTFVWNYTWCVATTATKTWAAESTEQSSLIHCLFAPQILTSARMTQTTATWILEYVQMLSEIFLVVVWKVSHWLMIFLRVLVSPITFSNALWWTDNCECISFVMHSS